MRKDGPELASMLTSVDISATQYTDVIDTISSHSIDNYIKKKKKKKKNKPSNCLKKKNLK